MESELCLQPELDLNIIDGKRLWKTEGLFSDHYLKAKIKENPWWPGNGEVEKTWIFCKDLYSRRKVPCAKNNEVFTRRELIVPILENLGYAWTDNLRLPAGSLDLEPDYLLFASKEEKENLIDKDKEARFKAAIGILEAKKLHHPLSQISKTQGRYPHQQIRDYLNEAQTVNWGILTNGNEWRLYCRDAKPSHYFSISLESALSSLENFKFFYVLFSSSAFVRDNDGKCRLDYVKTGAFSAQTELENDLRKRVFGIVENLANGFYSHTENRIREEQLSVLYDSCLILLYRLLFVLYAEGRKLLPVEDTRRKYSKELSLARLVWTLKNFKDYDSHTRTHLYDEVLELFHLINGTNEKKNEEYSVPRYNGGLFNPDKYPLLKAWKLPDFIFADVLRSLLFNPVPEPGQPSLPVETVDYSDLRVQQLGSIYEGLLEHRLVSEGGTLVLKNDKGERKATGTYYTPDYIVKYIVEQTLGPLVQKIEENKDVKKGKKNSFASEILKLNVCDPAMGSGHFLVEATCFLADKIIYHSTTQFKIVKKKGVAQDEEESANWRRRVVESCVYGVDINPLAVELAKLSLWLITVSSQSPLNFLDHHLRCGNSLVGARMDQLIQLPEKKKNGKPQISDGQMLFTFGRDIEKDIARAIKGIRQIESSESNTIESVKVKEKLWNENIVPALESYRKIADLWTSSYFGNEMDEGDYHKSIAKIMSGKNIPNPATEIYRFFHWELEFPDVFFNDDGSKKQNPGFDAVVGNPPYGHLLDEHENLLVEQTFSSAVGIKDVFGMFIECGTILNRKDGFCGWIVPSGWLTAQKYLCLRKIVVMYLTPQRIVHLPYNVFGDAYIDCIVFVAKKSIPISQDICLIKRFGNREHIDQIPSSETSYSLIHIQTWLDDPDNMMVTESGPGQWIRNWQRLHNFISLGEILVVSRGITPYLEPTEKDFRQKTLGFFGSVGRYLLDTERFSTVVYDPSLMEYKPRHFFEGARLIVRRIISRQHRIHAVLVKDDFVINKSYLIALNKSKSYSLEFILAILNSRLISKTFVSMSEIAKRDDFPQLDIATVCSLPILNIFFTTSAAMRKKLAEQGENIYEDDLKNIDTSGILAFANKQLELNRTDVIHDLLAMLAEQMIEYNKIKFETVKRFHTDLGDFHNIDVHTLTPKTRLDEFWKMEITEVFEHLRKNKKIITGAGLNLSIDDEDKIRNRFTSAKNSILPVERNIEFTDNLIDQIVYRLYGLTDDEIKIVGKSS